MVFIFVCFFFLPFFRPLVAWLVDSLVGSPDWFVGWFLSLPGWSVHSFGVILRGLCGISVSLMCFVLIGVA